MPIGKRFDDATTRDPFRNFMFIIKFDGVEVAACRKMSGLEASVNVVEFRAGNAKYMHMERSPGRIEYQTVTFESGKTHDEHFEKWANELITTEKRTLRSPPPNFRRNITVEVRDIDGQPALSYILYNAWVTSWTALSELAGEGNDTIIETIEVTHEGFDRQPVEAADAPAEEETEETA